MSEKPDLNISMVRLFLSYKKTSASPFWTPEDSHSITLYTSKSIRKITEIFHKVLGIKSVEMPTVK